MRTQGLLRIFLLIILIPSGLWANYFDVYGSGSRSSAMGNVGVSSSTDYHGTYYNPATLVLADRAVGIGTTFAIKSLQVNLSPRPDGYDIPDLGTQSPAIPLAYRLRSRMNQDEYHQTLGLFAGANTDLGTERLRLSFLAFLPMYQNASDDITSFSQEKEQFFSNQLGHSLIGGRIEHFMMNLGFAYRLYPWLSLGVGVNIMPNAKTDNYIYMDDPAQQDKIDLNLGSKVGTSWKANAGFLFIPNDSFRMGLGFREHHYFRISGQNEIQIRGLQNSDAYPIIQYINIINNYSPRQMYWGMTWIKKKWLLSSDLIYNVWSMYLDDHGNKSDQFKDTFSPRLGIEYQFYDDQKIRMGYAYQPSPIIDQTGRTNYVDNDRSMISLGSGHQITFVNTKLQLSWHVQFHYLHGREVIKKISGPSPNCAQGVNVVCDEVPDDTINPNTGKPWASAQGLQTGNPGFPGYSSGGWISQFGLELSWIF